MSKGDRQASGGDTVSRRDILQVSTGTAAIAGAAALMVGASFAAAQQRAHNNGIRTGEPQPFYDYSPITKRPKLKWPNGARVAVFIVPNVEHWDVHDDKGHMDVRNLPRNDYGPRVAAWRLMEISANVRIRRPSR